MASRFAILAEWVRSNGGTVHPSLALEPVSGSGFTLVVKQCVTPIEGDEELFSIPYGITLSYLNAVSAGRDGSGYHPRSQPLPDKFLCAIPDHDAVAYIFLMQQYLLGEQSFWYPYLSVLPQPGLSSQGSIPLLWQNDDLEWLRGTYLESVTHDRQELQHRWDLAAEALRRAGWDMTGYNFDLFLWACFVFKSRQFPSIALHGDANSLKPEYQSLVEVGVNLDDGPQILLPLLDSVNHEQCPQPTYGFRGAALTMCKGARLMPGDEIRYPYDKDDQRFNNTTLLRDFGFILDSNEAAELVFPPPFDTSIAMHPCHSIFSTASTIDEFYMSAAEMRQHLVTVRSTSRDARGPTNQAHEVPAFRHFHPVLISLVSFREANPMERVTLRKDPFALPTGRLRDTVARFLDHSLKEVLEQNIKIKELLGSPQNRQQELASRYRDEQISILEEILPELESSKPSS